MLINYIALPHCKHHPTRSNPSDSGCDLFYNGDDPIFLDKSDRKIIPTGIKIEIPHGYFIQIANRSSMSLKKGTLIGGGIIDSGYAGEIGVILMNVSNSCLQINPGDKIAQMIMIPCIPFRLIESEEIYEDQVTISNRGDQGFGSTDVKFTPNPFIGDSCVRNVINLTDQPIEPIIDFFNEKESNNAL